MHLKGRHHYVTTFVCFFLLLTLCGIVSPYQISSNFQQVLDVAAAKVVAKAEWINVIESTFLLSVPSCSSTSSYPSTFSTTKKNLVMCYDLGALEPWPRVYTKFAQMVVAEINAQYSLTLGTNVTEVDIIKLGYFPSLKNAVDSGDCDMAVASTHYSDSRGANAHFQCAYGYSYPGLLRTELENTTYTVTSEKDLNQNGLIIAVANTSTFDAYVTANCPKATIIRLDEYQDAWAMILAKKIHVLLGDGSDLYFWVSKNKNNCSSCVVKLYGDRFNYGSFITNLIAVSGSVSFTISTIGLVFSMLFMLFMM